MKEIKSAKEAVEYEITTTKQVLDIVNTALTKKDDLSLDILKLVSVRIDNYETAENIDYRDEVLDIMQNTAYLLEVVNWPENYAE